MPRVASADPVVKNETEFNAIPEKYRDGVKWDDRGTDYEWRLGEGKTKEAGGFILQDANGNPVELKYPILYLGYKNAKIAISKLEDKEILAMANGKQKQGGRTTGLAVALNLAGYVMPKDEADVAQLKEIRDMIDSLVGMNKGKVSRETVITSMFATTGFDSPQALKDALDNLESESNKTKYLKPTPAKVEETVTA